MGGRINPQVILTERLWYHLRWAPPRAARHAAPAPPRAPARGPRARAAVGARVRAYPSAKWPNTQSAIVLGWCPSVHTAYQDTRGFILAVRSAGRVSYRARSTALTAQQIRLETGS